MKAEVTPARERCPACGADTPVSQTGATHRYLLSSPGCWAAYGEVLAREYGEPGYWSVHALTVDAYAAQHPGVEAPQTVASINIHLASLLAHFERGVPKSELAALKWRLAQHKREFRWLPPPDDVGALTVADIVAVDSAERHVEAAVAWSRCAFDAWSAHHDAVRALLDRAGCR
ncbi:MAG: DUF5946 family protein [Pseudomonadota bacterium]